MMVGAKRAKRLGQTRLAVDRVLTVAAYVLEQRAIKARVKNPRFALDTLDQQMLVNQVADILVDPDHLSVAKVEAANGNTVPCDLPQSERARLRA